MTYQTEFPDFPAADMPAIPEGFVDRSWKNEMCPSFQHDALGLCIWIDYVDPAQRDFLASKRFLLQRVDETGAPLDETREPTEEGSDLLTTDDWNEVLAAILGEAFVAVLLDQLTEQELAEVRRRNASPEYGDKVCATHDFLDANMSMLEAFQHLLQRDPKFLEGTDEHGNHSPEGEADMALWNAAWDRAKKAHLTEKETANALSEGAQ